MAKAKTAKPPKPVKAKKEKPVKAKKEKVPKQPKSAKPRAPKVKRDKVKSDLYTVILMLTFFALAAACVLLYLNNAWHATHM